ncbi:MAG: LysR family transcriptional regulator [Hyphomicrobium sp.]|jgi:LysR family transcriptional regulator for metE and metH
MKEKLNHRLMRDVTLKQLRVMPVITRCGRITTAANELGITPPAVTLQLKQLEDAAGLALFERTRQGLRLTDAGIYVLGVQARIEAMLLECSDALSEMKGLTRGRVSVGVISTAKYFAPRAIAAFAAAHPRVEVKLTEGNREKIIAALEQFDLDIAIMGSPPDTLAAVQQAIGEHPFIIIAPPGHRLAARRRVALSALANEKFLLREPGSGTRTLMERLFAKHEIAPRISTEFGSNETIKQAVMAGLGLAFISAHTVAAEVAAGWLSILPVEGLPVVRQWCAVRAKQKHLLPAGLAMWDFLVAEGAGFLPNI